MLGACSTCTATWVNGALTPGKTNPKIPSGVSLILAAAEAHGQLPAAGLRTNRPECASHVREECHSVQGGYRGFRVVLGPVLSGGK